MTDAPVRIRLAIFAVVAAIAVTYAGAHYARLTDRFGSTTYAVRADLAVSGGIFPGAEVTYRGVPIGRVDTVIPSSDGVVAGLKIDKQWKVPASARAEVHDRSAVGEQYVDLVPTSNQGPNLRDGAMIPISRTSTPLPPEELLNSLDRFVQSVDTANLATMVNELGTGFVGTGPDIGKILDGSTQFVDAARTNLDATAALLQNSETVLTTQVAKSADLQSFSHDLAAFTSAVSTHDASLRQSITNGAALAAELSAAFKAVQPTLFLLTGNLAVLAGIGARNVDALEQTLVALPYNVSTVPAGARGGAAQFVLQTTSNPGVCQPGYLPPSLWRSTQDLSPAAPDYSVHCADGSLLPRGANAAPPAP